MDFQIRVRNGFSDRNKIKPENTIIQSESLDERSRIAISNAINAMYHLVFSDDYSGRARDSFWRTILSDVFVRPVNYDSRYDEKQMLELVHNNIMKGSYDDLLTLVEYTVNIFIKNAEYEARNIREIINSVFINEYIGYRLVDNTIINIIDPVEIESLESAVEIPITKVNNHLKKSIQLFSDRKNPDYSNSIKESISAVEAMCSIINGKSDSLGDALNKLEKSGVYIHGALKAAFNQLYGYTSDASGIRHSGKLDGPDASFGEAKFMLVTCSAFVNYLMEQKALSL